MKKLFAFGSVVGMAAGVVFGVLAHHSRAGIETGWTLYRPAPRRYADYLPTPDAPWLPGLLEYAAAGLLAGLLIAFIAAGLGFRLAHVKSRKDHADA